jgi:hypothetical protein
MSVFATKQVVCVDPSAYSQTDFSPSESRIRWRRRLYDLVSEVEIDEKLGHHVTKE